MPEVEGYPAGTFCWADLATTDAPSAKQFYMGLFGWEAVDNPMGEGMVYTMFNRSGKSICALYQMDENMRSQGIPPFWMNYVSVGDVDQSAAKVKELGGTLMMEPFDVYDAGRMTVAQDPTGVAFSMWQPKEHIGAEINLEPGTICWNEMYTKDTEAASRFYNGLFGWSADKTAGAGGMDYTMFKMGEMMTGGMMEIQEDWGELPPHWALYFLVEDLDASIKKAQDLGGKLAVNPMEIDIGRFAFIEDPQGAHFGIFEEKGQ